MRIHDTAFMHNPYVYYDILDIATITGQLSHQVLLENVSWCNNNFLSRHQSVLVAKNYANRYPFLETVGELQVILVNVLTLKARLMLPRTRPSHVCCASHTSNGSLCLVLTTLQRIMDVQ